MHQMHKKRAVKRSYIIPILALAAAGGWSAYAYSALSFAEIDKQLRGQATILQQYQAQYQQERKRADDAQAELNLSREQLSSARSELDRLSKINGEMETELAKAKTQLQTVQQDHDRQDEQAKAALIRIPPRPTPRDVAAAQEALTKLNFGPLEADGVVGPDTRRAVEEFQRTVGLTVTGELHAETLQALLRAARVMAVQEEQSRKPL